MLNHWLPKDRAARVALGITAAYVAITLCWVFITDQVLSQLVVDPELASSLASFKPIAFIGVSAGLMFILISRFNRVEGNAARQSSDLAAAESQSRDLSKYIALTVGAAIVLVMFNLIYSLNSDRAERIRVAQESAQNLAQAIDEHTASIFKTLDLSLSAAARAVAAPAANTQQRNLRVATQLLADLRALPYARTLFIVDASGNIVLTTEATTEAPTKFASQSYFIEARDNPSDRLLIGNPAVNWISGADMFAVARRIETTDGKFAGIAVAAIESSRLQSFYDALKVGERGSISIVKRDGTLLVRSPFIEGVVGNNYSNTVLFKDALPAKKTGTYTTDSQLDGTRKIFSYRELGDWPVVVSIGLSEADVLGAWVGSARIYSFISLGFVLALIWLGWLLWRGLKQQNEFTSQAVENEERFRALTELLSDWYWEQDAELRFTKFSPNFFDRTGIRPETLIGKRPEELSGYDRGTLTEALPIQQERRPFRDRTYLRWATDGSEQWFQSSGIPLFDDKGEFRGYRGTGKDVTPLMRAQQAVVESEKRYRTMFDANPHPMWVFDSKSNGFLAVNQAACRQYGYTADEFMDMTIFDLRPPSEIPKLKAQLAKPVPEREEQDWLHRKKNGDLITVRIRSDMIDFFELPARIVLALDITEQRKAEAEILKLNSELEERVSIRTAELESMNRELESFSYSVAHDLRAPLRHITGYAGLLLESRAGLPDTTQRYLDIISKAAENMGNLIDAMLDLSRVSRVAVELAAVDMNRLITEVLVDAKREAGERSIQWSIDELPNVMGDVRLLRQVFINLVTNAVKFTAKRADATIEIGIDQLHRGQLRDGEVVIYVRDNGAGFDMAHANKLFDAFQRLHTQADFPGTGVGLATVSRIIDRHGGRVWAEGQPEQGATFYVSLKRASAIALKP